MEITGLFQAKEISEEKLLAFGFRKTDGGFSYEETISGGEFLLTVTISQTGHADYRVADAQSGEEYALVKTAARGAFVDAVREECETIFSKIREKCFLKAGTTGQAGRLVSHIRETYGAEPEFLWETYPDFMVFRHKENKKWFALLMTIPWNKLEAGRAGEIAAVDLRAMGSASTRLGEPGYYPGYHMNKKYWYTAVLEGTLSDEELFSRVRESFDATK